MLNIISYNSKSVSKQQISCLDIANQTLDNEKINWFDLEHTLNNEVAALCSYFNIHPLTKEDILDLNHLPKVEEFEHYVFVTLKMLNWDKSTSRIQKEHLSLILHSNTVISIQEGKDGDVFHNLKERIEKGIGMVRLNGSDYLLARIISAIVLHYQTISEEFRSALDAIEAQLLKYPQSNINKELFNIKSDIAILRRYSIPLREQLKLLNSEHSNFITPNVDTYFRDSYDTLISVISNMDSSREMIKDIMDLKSSQLNQEMNGVMKTLTIISTIFIPLTFIAGVYGMNFKFMPELEEPNGYFITLFVMLFIAIGLLVFMKFKRWL